MSDPFVCVPVPKKDALALADHWGPAWPEVLMDRIHKLAVSFGIKAPPPRPHNPTPHGPPPVDLRPNSTKETIQTTPAEDRAAKGRARTEILLRDRTEEELHMLKDFRIRLNAKGFKILNTPGLPVKLTSAKAACLYRQLVHYDDTPLEVGCLFDCVCDDGKKRPKSISPDLDWLVETVYWEQQVGQ